MQLSQVYGPHISQALAFKVMELLRSFDGGKQAENCDVTSQEFLKLISIYFQAKVIIKLQNTFLAVVHLITNHIGSFLEFDLFAM